MFFCYALPAPPAETKQKEQQIAEDWTEEAGDTRWYLFDLATEKIAEDPAEIIEFVRCTPDTPRRQTIEKKTLSEIRAKVDKHIKNGYRLFGHVWWGSRDELSRRQGLYRALRKDRRGTAAINGRCHRPAERPCPASTSSRNRSFCGVQRWPAARRRTRRGSRWVPADGLVGLRS